MNNCRNCAKIFCEKRDEINNCNMKISFIQANVLEPPKKIEKDYYEYGGITMQEACENLEQAMLFFSQQIGGIENE